ncbi:MAG: Ig-like domain-containing protein, partial [Bacteroidales bacterium]
DNNGQITTTTWNGHTYPVCTTANEYPVLDAHISRTGEIRLAKATWWMLARIAGWDGISSSYIPVSSITITGGTAITTRGGTLQLAATVQPSNATNKAVTWSLTGGSANAVINSTTGLLTAVADGTVTVRSTANDGSGVYGATTVTISGQSIQAIPVTIITVTGGTSISTDGGTLQLYATVLPSNATDKSVVWSISSDSGQATMDESGLIRAVSNGTVTVKATAEDGSGVYGTLTVTIINQVVEVKSISIAVSKGTAAITVDDGTVTLTANVTPSNATNKTVIWSVLNETGFATINSAGILTAVANGTVTVKATAIDGSGISSTLRVAISNQINQIESITIMAENGVSTISDSAATLQLKVLVAPYYATNQEVIWSINNITGRAFIGETGLVSAISNGVVTVKAVAADGSGVSDVMDISINLVPSDPLLVIVGENDLCIPINEYCTDCRMSLYDLNGRLLDIKPVESNLLVFERSNLRSGIYLVVLDNKYAILKTGKVIIHQ